MFTIRLCIVFLLLTGAQPVEAQQQTVPAPVAGIKAKLLARYAEKRNRYLNRQLDKIEAGIVKKMEAAEAELITLIQKADSVKARYLTLAQTKLSVPDTVQLPLANFAEMDRAITGNRFIQQAQAVQGLNVNRHTGRINNATSILKTQLGRFTAIDVFAASAGSKLQYYREMAVTVTGAAPLVDKLESCRQLLQTKMDALRQKALQLSKTEIALFNKIEQLQGFSAFRQLQSGIAALFPFSNNGLGPLQPGQLQTTASVTQLLPAGIASFNPSTGIRTPQLEAGAKKQAAEMLQRLSQKAGQLQGNGDAAAVNGANAAVQGNTKKRKPFSVQFDAQFNRPTGFFPVTAQLGVRSGYTFRNTPLQAGLGIAYNAGLGTSFRNIGLSNEGVSLRSFFEWKQKRGFLVYGGYELSHLNRFASIPGLKKSDYWRAHALAGIAKQYAIGKKWKGSLLIAYDFLYNTRTPVGNAVIFRTGFGL
jgi:hypothetical protein